MPRILTNPSGSISLSGLRRQERARDDVLVDRARKGDLDAFGELVKPHRRLLEGVARAIVGPQGSEDVVQDCILIAFRKLPTYELRGFAFKTYLTSIASHRAFEYRRAKQRSGSTSLDSGPLVEIPVHCLENRDLHIVVQECIEKLKREYRQVLRLYVYEGFDHGKIGHVLGIPENTSKTYLRIARHRTKACVEGRRSEI